MGDARSRRKEAFRVLRGRIEVLVADTRRVLEQGEHLTVACTTVALASHAGTTALSADAVAFHDRVTSGIDRRWTWLRRRA